jgi:hypothetical protein
MEAQTMIRRAFGEESMSHTLKVQTHRPKERARQAKSKVKRLLIVFFDIKGIVHKEFVLAAQTVSSAYYCDILGRLCENVLRLFPELWRQKNWLLHHDNAPSHISFFTRELWIKNIMIVFHHPPYSCLFS